MIPLNLIEWHERPIFQQLQLEEALLRTDGGNWCLINQGTTPAIVMGISGKPEKWIHPAFFERKPFPLIRRFSGGGTVVVDKHTLFVTFICNKADINIPPSLNTCCIGPVKFTPLFSIICPFALKKTTMCSLIKNLAAMPNIFAKTVGCITHHFYGTMIPSR